MVLWVPSLAASQVFPSPKTIETRGFSKGGIRVPAKEGKVAKYKKARYTIKHISDLAIRLNNKFQTRVYIRQYLHSRLHVQNQRRTIFYFP